MQRTSIVVIVIAALLMSSGCVFSIGGGKGSCPPVPECKACAAQIVSSTCLEIDAAGKLSSEESRLEIYQALAQRPNLTATERAHLVEAVTRHLNTEENRAAVLLLLAQNEG